MLRAVLFVLASILIYLLAALVLSLLTTQPDPIACEEPQQFYVSTNGVHLDIVIPISQIAEADWEGVEVPKGIHYLAVGWGDKGFYLETPTWEDLSAKVAIKALFGASETAMHLTYYYRPSSNWKQLELCPDQAQSLIAFIQASFQEDAKGRFIPIPGVGYTDLDVFFEAKGNYSVFRTCNNWANEALKAAKVKTALWAPFDKGVLRHL